MRANLCYFLNIWNSFLWKEHPFCLFRGIHAKKFVVKIFNLCDTFLDLPKQTSILDPTRSKDEKYFFTERTDFLLFSCIQKCNWQFLQHHFHDRAEHRAKQIFEILNFKKKSSWKEKLLDAFKTCLDILKQYLNRKRYCVNLKSNFSLL